MIPFLDCQGLAGAWTVGTALTGRFRLDGRTSLPGGFGDSSMDANRHIVGEGWEQQTGSEHEWEPMSGIAFVCGTPPCSGFSLLSSPQFRGIDSPINSCMQDLVRFGGRNFGTDGQRGAEFVSLESVQGAFREGRPLMQRLREALSERTGHRYSLTHVKMSGSSIGAAQMRHRYYAVWHRVPFGLQRPEPRKVVTYADAIGDLADLELIPVHQPYRNMPSDWILEQGMYGSGGTVDWHVPWGTEEHRQVKLLYELDPYLEWGQSMQECIRRLDEPPPTLLANYGYTEENWREPRGWGWPTRIDPNRPGYVLTGAGGSQFIHWAEPRFLTLREGTRLMGYPDDWSWPTDLGINQINALVGKCCPVQSGRWLSENIADSLEDPSLPHAEPAELIGEDEYLFDCTLDYRRWPVEISQYEYRPGVKAA